MRSNELKGISVLVVFLAAIASNAAMPAQTWAQYIKSFIADSDVVAPDPTTAAGGSWTIGGTSSATVPKMAGSEGGHNYWEVNDTNTSSATGNPSNNSVIYNVTSTIDPSVQTALTSPSGWEMTIRLKISASANPTLTPPAYNVPTFIDIRNGRKIYDLAFVNDGSNEGVYHPSGGTTFNADDTTLVAALDLDVYHTFNMVMVPNVSDHTQDVVNVYIDGSSTPAATFNDAGSGGSTLYRVQWGSGLAAATQTVFWQDVTFQTLPIVEPFGPGDANGDGTVNADDYALIDRGFAGQRVGWSNGDFNADGLINADDYLIIDTAYAQLHPMSPDFLSSREAQFGDGYVSRLLAAVPEPTSLAAVGLVGMFMMSRRRGV